MNLQSILAEIPISKSCILPPLPLPTFVYPAHVATSFPLPVSSTLYIFVPIAWILVDVLSIASPFPSNPIHIFASFQSLHWQHGRQSPPSIDVVVLHPFWHYSNCEIC